MIKRAILDIKLASLMGVQNNLTLLSGDEARPFEYSDGGGSAGV